MNVSIGDQAIVTYIYSIILILYELVVLLISSYYNRQYKRYYDRPTQGKVYILNYPHILILGIILIL